MSKYDRMTDEQLLCDYKNGNQEIMDYLMVKYKSNGKEESACNVSVGGRERGSDPGRNDRSDQSSGGILM